MAFNLFKAAGSVLGFVGAAANTINPLAWVAYGGNKLLGIDAKSPLQTLGSATAGMISDTVAPVANAIAKPVGEAVDKMTGGPEIREAEENAQLAENAAALAEKQKLQSAEIAARQQEAEVRAGNEESRKATAQAFQSESAGEAALAGSGLADGSSPYLALETQVAESGRAIRSWWQGAREATELGGIRTSMQRASADQNISLLRKQAADYREGADEMKADRTFNFFANAISMGVSLYNLGTSAYAAGKSLGGLDGILEGDGPGLLDSMREGGELKYAKATGDFSFFNGPTIKPLASMPLEPLQSFGMGEALPSFKPVQPFAPAAPAASFDIGLPKMGKQNNPLALLVGGSW